MTTNVPMQAPPVALYQPGPVHPPSSFNRKAALITGYMQISLAVVSLAFGVACIVSEYFFAIIAVPIWGALGFYLVAGILGVVAGHTNGRNSGVIVGCLVMSILAAVTALVHIIMGSLSTAFGRYYSYYFYEDVHDGWYVINILCVLVGVVQFVTAIVSSVFMCCGTGCCCEQQTSNGVGQQQYSSYVVQPGQVVNQGQVAIQGYPMMQQQVVGQPQFTGQPQQNVQGMGQAPGQLPAYTEHETKEVPQV